MCLGRQSYDSSVTKAKRGMYERFEWSAAHCSVASQPPAFVKDDWQLSRPAVVRPLHLSGRNQRRIQPVIHHFAKLLGVSMRTWQEWEQGRKKPTGAAQTLLRVAVQAPEALLNLQ